MKLNLNSRKSLSILICLVFCGHFFQGQAYCFGFNLPKSVPGAPEVPGVTKKQSKTSKVQKVENANELIASMLQEIMPAKDIETRGINMIQKAKGAVDVANIVLVSSNEAIENVSQIFSSLAEGKKVVNDTSKKVFEQFSKMKSKYNNSMDEFDAKKTDVSWMEENAGIDIDKNSYNLKKKHLNIFHKETETIKQAFLTEHGVYARMLKDSQEEFKEKILFPVVNGLAKNKAFITKMNKNSSETFKLLKEVDIEADKESKQLFKDGTRMLAVLALQKNKVTDLYEQLAKDPWNNKDNIIDLKNILSDIAHFVKAIKHHKEQITKANVYIDDVAEALNNANKNYDMVNNQIDSIFNSIKEAVRNINSADSNT